MNKSVPPSPISVEAEDSAELSARDPWQSLTEFTQARIGLGRCGVSIPTARQLQFNLDHAKARDAVHVPLNVVALVEQLQNQGMASLCLQSQAPDRATYLTRPDLGRQLHSSSVAQLQAFTCEHTSEHKNAVDIAIVLVDGLSSIAVQSQGAALVRQLTEALNQCDLVSAPLCIVSQGRVAIGDQVAEHLNAKACLLIVGERPGLSSPDSLGIYYTYQARSGLTDADRNCISNIRPAGLSIEQAVHKAVWLVNESMRLKLSGVNLKDKSEQPLITSTSKLVNTGNFLVEK